MSSPRIVSCPQCGKDAVFSPENPSRPFCSERCRLIDLGEWASEGYKVTVQDQNSQDSMDQLMEELEAEEAAGDENSRRDSEDSSEKN